MTPKKNSKNKSRTAKTAQPGHGRLVKGKIWIANYNGQHIVRSYAKHFRVDLVCAIIELRHLGVEISEQYETAVKETFTAIAKQKQLGAENKRNEIEATYDSDDNFAFIIGYTSGGAAYGVRWEDMPADEDELE